MYNSIIEQRISKSIHTRISSCSLRADLMRSFHAKKYTPNSSLRFVDRSRHLYSVFITANNNNNDEQEIRIAQRPYTKCTLLSNIIPIYTKKKRGKCIIETFEREITSDNNLFGKHRVLQVQYLQYYYYCYVF